MSKPCPECEGSGFKYFGNVLCPACEGTQLETQDYSPGLPNYVAPGEQPVKRKKVTK